METRRTLTSLVLVGVLGITAACSSNAGDPDAGHTDSGQPPGTVDAGFDAGLDDGGTEDAGVEDAGMTDAGSEDGGTEPPDAGTPCDLGETFHSQLAWYEEPSSSLGSCSVPLSFSHYAALNSERMGMAAACGMCLLITGTDGKSVRVRVADECPSCASNRVDVSKAAFEVLADPDVGALTATVEPIPCEEEETLEYRFEAASNDYFLQFVVWNHAQPIARVELKPSPGDLWLELTRTSYNAFQYTSMSGAMPQQVGIRVTDIHGHVVEDPAVARAAGTVVQSAGQFPLTCDG